MPFDRYETERNLDQTDTHQPELRLFGRLLSVAWGLLLIGTMIVELTPRDPTWVPQMFYPITVAKGLMFLLLGFVSPLAFWKFNSLGVGVLFAVITAGAVESLQTLLVGHHASYLEFTAKLLLVILGFVLALVARHDRKLQIGPFHIILSDPHLSQKE